MHIIRDLLDKQIVDRDACEVGRVDGIVVELRENGPPVVVAFELGFVPLAHRIGRRAEALVEALHRRFSVRQSARFHIPWADVTDVNVHHVRIRTNFEDIGAADWERWLRKNVIRRLPGGSGNPEK